MVALAQTVRAPGCELGGCGFEPRTSPQHVHALVAEWLKALDCKSGERKLHVSSNLTECSNLL